ncbi:MAG: ankyrin repeat domain-containing protein, partial [Gemmatimonadetes bacterium]|nr:ankyrin repeat domain-containing protein [Gemmatimonadota bacterium]
MSRVSRVRSRARRMMGRASRARGSPGRAAKDRASRALGGLRRPRGLRVDLVGAAVAMVVIAAAAGGARPSNSPVADAAMRDDVEAVRALIAEGADVNAPRGDGMTGLHWAALNGNAEIARMLIDAGADLEAVTRLGAHRPLHVA